MKRLQLLLPAALLMLLLFSACTGGESKSREHDSEIQTALTEIQKQWKSLYSETPEAEPYLEVKNTRLIFLREDREDTLEDTGMDEDYLAEADIIVEFVLFSDYMGSAPYYENIGIYDCVAFNRDGSIKVLDRNPFQLYRARTYNSDFSDIIESIEDCGSSYDQIIAIK